MLQASLTAIILIDPPHTPGTISHCQPSTPTLEQAKAQLSPILFAIYLAPVIKTFKKRIKNLKENIPTDILSFVDNSLLISQKKSYSLFSSFFLCSYNIMSKILVDTGLVMEHSKTKLFHFTRARHLPIPLLTYSRSGALLSLPNPSGDTWVFTSIADSTSITILTSMPQNAFSPSVP